MRAGSTYHWYLLFHWTWRIAFSAPDDSCCSTSTWRDVMKFPLAFFCVIASSVSQVSSVCSKQCLFVDLKCAILHNVHAFLCYFQCHQIVKFNCFVAKEFAARKIYEAEWKYAIWEIILKFMSHTLQKSTTKKKNICSFFLIFFFQFKHFK